MYTHKSRELAVEGRAIVFLEPYLNFQVGCKEKMKDFRGLLPDFVDFLVSKNFSHGRDLLIIEMVNYVAKICGRQHIISMISDEVICLLINDLKHLSGSLHLTPAILTYINVRMLGCLRRYPHQ